MKKDNLLIDEFLVKRLIASQFPEWRDLSISPVQHQGWDNRTFHLGKQLLVRLPSDNDYTLQVEKERQWLPKLAPFLPLSIPAPLAMGQPAEEYPWKWSVYAYLPGEAANNAPIANLTEFAINLGEFLVALQSIDTTYGPLPGLHSFYRGGELSIYDAETRQAIDTLKHKLDVKIITDIWQTALASKWARKPVWVHGDISLGNLLVQDGKLTAVIDFGQLTVGDPACDLAIAWTFFKDENREAFRSVLALDKDTWARGRGWALWKALITAAGQSNSNAIEAKEPWRIIDEIVKEFLS